VTPAPEPLPDSDQASRNAAVAAFMTFAAFFGLGFVIPLLPLYMQDLGVRDSSDAAQWAGFLIGVGPLLAGILAPFWGGLADRHGYKPVALVALVALGLSQIVAAVARTPAQVLVSRVLSGLFGGVGPLGLAMASGNAPKGAGASKAIGSIQAAQILAAGFGPLFGGAVASTFGIPSAFWVASCACLLAAVVVGALYRDPARSAVEGAVSRSGPEAPRTEVFLMSLIAVVFFANFASRSFTPILPEQLARFGLDRAALPVSTGLLISAYSIAAAASALFVGRAAAKNDPVVLILRSLALSLLAALAMGYAPGFAAFLGIAVLYGLVSGGSLTLGYTIGSRRFGESARGAYFGRLSGAALIGGAVSPSVAAFVARSGMAMVYWMNVVIYAGLILATLAFLRRPPATSDRG